MLGLRDMLDDPDRVAQAWAASGVSSVISGLYDDILIYGNKKFFATDAAYGLSALAPGSGALLRRRDDGAPGAAGWL
ncbi:MAG: hypothetical protein HC844_21850, partial [Tabrizicola sp.]|nr:hypothetical protein [Tabrizicola sp.]